jgi:ketosteroid isomerase-like protein
VIEVEECVDLGHGVVFARVWEDGRVSGSDGHVEQRRGWVLVWVEGKIARAAAYLEVDEARAAAKRLAESRA